MRFSIQPTPMRVDLRPDLRPFAVSSQADGGLPRRPRRCAAGLGAASAFLGVFGGENEEGARNTYVAGILLAEANGSNQILRYYVYGQGLLAMVTPSGASYSYHYDATGNTVAMTDGSQAVVNRYAYTPYGQIVGKAESVPQPFQYVGQSGVMAEPNGFYYMRARYYDPEVGRFVSEDPIGFEGGDVNLYAYVGGNPVMFVDPEGEIAVLPIIAGVAAAKGIAIGTAYVGTKIAQWAANRAGGDFSNYDLNQTFKLPVALAGAETLAVGGIAAVARAPQIATAVLSNPGTYQSAIDATQGFFEPGPPPPTLPGLAGNLARQGYDRIAGNGFSIFPNPKP